MSWPQWPTSATSGIVQPPIINPAPSVVNPSSNPYTPEQWAQMQHQNWQQWAQWQQQFQQWQQQYGAEYQKSMNAIAQTTVTAQPPAPYMPAPPLPAETKPPPPPDEPVGPPPQPNAAPFSLNVPPPMPQSNYSTAPPPLLQTPNKGFEHNYNTQRNSSTANQGNFPGSNPNNQQKFGRNSNYNNNNRGPQGQNMNWQNQSNRNQQGFNRFNQPPHARADDNKPEFGMKRPYVNPNDTENSKRNKLEFNEANKWEGNQQKPHWGEGQRPLPQNPPVVQQESSAPVKINPEELSEAEKKFDKQFKDWQGQFQKWKEQNANHPDKEQYRQYEKKWETWRAQLLERREQMRRKRLGLSETSPQPTSDKPIVNKMEAERQLGAPLDQSLSKISPKSNNEPDLTPLNKSQDTLNEVVAPINIVKQVSLETDETNSAEFSRPPPNLNNQPLEFKKSNISASDSYTGAPLEERNEELRNLDEGTSDFLRSKTSDGIPGLDLVKDGETDNSQEESASNKETETAKPDLEAISRGINSILGDQKLMNMLSLVSQNQNRPFASPVPAKLDSPKFSPPEYNQEDNDYSNDDDQSEFFKFEKPDSNTYHDTSVNEDNQSNFDTQTKIDEDYNEEDMSSFDHGGNFQKSGSGPGSFDKNLSNVGRGPPSFSKDLTDFDRGVPPQFNRPFGKPNIGLGNSEMGPGNINAAPGNSNRFSDNFTPGNRDFDNFAQGPGGFNKLSNFNKNSNFGREPGNFDRNAGNFSKDSDNFNRGPHNIRGTENFNRGLENFNRGPDGFNKGSGNFNRGPDNLNKSVDNFNKGPNNFNRVPEHFNRDSENFNRDQGPDNFNRGFNNAPRDSDSFEKGSNFMRAPNAFNRDPDNYARNPPNVNENSQNIESFDRGPGNFNRPPGNFNRAPDNFNRGTADFDGDEKFDNFSPRPNNAAPGNFNRGSATFDRDIEKFDNFNRGPNTAVPPGNFYRGSGSFDRDVEKFDNFNRGPNTAVPPGNFNRGSGSFDRDVEKFDNFNRGPNTAVLPPGNFNRGSGDFDRDAKKFDNFSRGPNIAVPPGNFNRGPNSFNKESGIVNKGPVSFNQDVDRFNTKPLDFNQKNYNRNLNRNSDNFQTGFDRNQDPMDDKFNLTQNSLYRDGDDSNKAPGGFGRSEFKSGTPNRNHASSEINRLGNHNLVPRKDVPNCGEFERAPYSKQQNFGKEDNFNRPGPILPSHPLPFSNEPTIENLSESKITNELEQSEGIWKTNNVTDYDHKTLTPEEPEIILEPCHTFDYRHKPLNRIPYPSRPKWLSDMISKYPEFDISSTRNSRTLEFRRFPIKERFESYVSYEDRGRKAYDDRNRRNFEDQDMYMDRERKFYDDRSRKSHESKEYRGYEDRDRKTFEGKDKIHDDTSKNRNSRNFEMRSDSKALCGFKEPIFPDDKESDNFDDFEDEGDLPLVDKPSAEKVNIEDGDKRKSAANTKIVTGSIAPKSNVTLIEDILSPPGRFNRAPRIVIILRGPPGSGKSFLAKLIKDKEVENGGSAPRILCLDDYFMIEQEKEVEEDGRKVKVKEMVYEFEEGMEASYRQSLMKSFKKTVTDGYFNFIIVDNINDKVKYFGEMWSFAKQNGFQVYICEMELDVQICTKRNIHGRAEDEIAKCVAGWERSPSHHPVLDATSLIQSGSIPEVEMEEINSPSSENLNEEERLITSKWDSFDYSNDNLAKLDGTNKPLRTSRTMEDYLQLDDDWIQPVSTKPGQKRVRWADLEERKEQEKMRAIGFVVGQTNWDRMMDPTMGGSALTQTKYIERYSKY